jgi:hypothetical protein
MIYLSFSASAETLTYLRWFKKSSLLLIALLVFPIVAAEATTELVSVHSDGSLANGASFNPSISADGRYVAFNSDASNLVDGDRNYVSGHSKPLLLCQRQV